MDDALDIARRAVDSSGVRPVLAQAQTTPAPTIASILGNTEEAKAIEKNIGVIAGDEGKAALLDALMVARNPSSKGDEVARKFHEFYQVTKVHLLDPAMTADQRKAIVDASKALDDPALAVTSHGKGNAEQGMKDFFTHLDAYRAAEKRNDGDSMRRAAISGNNSLSQADQRMDNLIRESLQEAIIHGPVQTAPAKQGAQRG